MTIGVFGGSGFYRFLDGAKSVSVDTPYGPPSAPVTVGEMDGHPVAFLPRHGVGHELPPHRVNFRANVWALHSLGVSRIIGPSACGSLRADVHPGEVVVLDQLVDRTHGRADTYFDGPDAGGVGHVPFADPYCPELRSVLLGAAGSAGVTAHDGGTVVVINGPRFSTRAESAWFRAQGWDVVNMTQYPEAVLAREMGICYAGAALVTDYDTGVEGSHIDGVDAEPVTIERVLEVLGENVERTRALLAAAIPAVPATFRCRCAEALASGPMTS